MTQTFALVDSGHVTQIVEADGTTVPAIACRDRVMPVKPDDADDDWVPGPVEDWPEGEPELRPLYPASMDWRPCAGTVQPGWTVASNGTFSAPPPPASTPAPVPTTISDRQFAQQLAIQGVISEDDALDWVGPGVIPPGLATAISGLPANQQFPARMLLTGATVFERNHPMVSVLAGVMSWTDPQVDDLWRAAAVL